MSAPSVNTSSVASIAAANPVRPWNSGIDTVWRRSSPAIAADERARGPGTDEPPQPVGPGDGPHRVVVDVLRDPRLGELNESGMRSRRVVEREELDAPQQPARPAADCELLPGVLETLRGRTHPVGANQRDVTADLQHPSHQHRVRRLLGRRAIAAT